MPTFRTPHYMTGEDALEQIDLVPGSKALIITDKILVKLGLAKKVTDVLDDIGRTWQIFDEVEPDPKESTVLKVRELCLSYQPDMIIGLGGGSSIDTAKASWYLYENEKLTIDDLVPWEQISMGVKAKMVAIPTTSGTGAEATWASVITRIDENGQDSKLECPHLDTVPTFAILDPIFTQGLPKVLTVATGFDALAQGCEGLISDWRHDLADACCFHSIEMVKEYLPKVVQEPDNLEYREKMTIAATLSGMGFGNSQVVLGHAIGHSLGAVFHITHGHAVGVVLPHILEFAINDPEDNTGKKILAHTSRKLGLCPFGDDDTTCAHALVKFIRDLQKEVGFPDTIEKLGITREQLDAKMDRVIELTNESPSVTMNLRTASNANIKAVIECAFEGKPVDF